MSASITARTSVADWAPCAVNTAQGQSRNCIRAARRPPDTRLATRTVHPPRGPVGCRLLGWPHVAHLDASVLTLTCLLLSAAAVDLQVVGVVAGVRRARRDHELDVQRDISQRVGADHLADD